MFWQVVTIEHSKLFKRRLPWVALAILALAVAALYIALFAAAQGIEGAQAELEEMLTWPAGLMSSLSFAAGQNLGGLLMIVIVGAAMGQEYTWHTLQLWLGRGIPRRLFLGAKFVALLLPAVLIVLTPLAVGAVVTALFNLQLQGQVPVGQVNWLQLGLKTLLTAITLLPYASLAFFLAVLSRSAIVAIAGGLAFSLLIENIALQLLAFAGGTWAQIGQYLPAGLARALLDSNAGLTVSVGNSTASAAPATQPLEPAAAAVGILLYVLTLVVASTLVFRRQDFSG